MNKKILSFFVVMLTAVMLATPVLADPTKGQKVPIELWWTMTGTAVEIRVTGGVVHRIGLVYWDVVLDIDGVPTYFGTAVTERNMVIVPKEDGARLVVVDYYVLSFPDDGGGFEGNAQIMLTGYNPTDPPTWEMAKSHGLFKGTGAFAGQTINAGRHWRPMTLPMSWIGYLLKP